MGVYQIMMKRNLDSLMHYLYKAKQQLKHLKNNKIENKIYLDLAKAYQFKGNYDSVTYYTSKIINKIKEPSAVRAQSYSLISKSYAVQENIKKAKEYSKKEYEECKKLEIDGGIASALMDYGSLFLDRNNADIDSAFIYLKRAKKIFTKINDQYSLKISNEKLGVYYRLTKQYKKAYEILGNKYFEQPQNYAKTGEIIYFLKSKQKGENLFKKALEKYNKTTYDSAYTYQQMHNTYKNDKQYKKALIAYENSIKLQEKIKTKKFKENLASIEVKYQTQQKENKILRLSNENNKQKVAITQTRLLIAIILAIVSALALITYFKWRKEKQEQQLKILEKSIEASDNEKSRIGRELHDGIASKIIQLANNSENLNIKYTQKLQDIYNEVRSLSHQLNSTATHANEPIFERILELKSNIKNQKVNLKITPISLVVKEPIATHIYRITQELFANNIKHANSTVINISISKENNHLLLSYHDNGKGINTKDLKKGEGFKNIEHRVNLIKGTIKYNHLQTKGFSLTIKTPLL